MVINQSFQNLLHFLKVLITIQLALTHLINYQYFAPGGYYTHSPIEQILQLFCWKNTFHNIGEKHIIHFMMDLPVVFFQVHPQEFQVRFCLKNGITFKPQKRFQIIWYKIGLARTLNLVSVGSPLVTLVSEFSKFMSNFIIFQWYMIQSV